MKIIDLSVTIDNYTPADPPQFRPQIEYQDHKKGAEETCGLLGCEMKDLPDGNGIAAENIRFMSTHAGTHMDAPYHFYPTMDGGKPSWTIDEVPLEYFIGNAVVMDFSDKEPGYIITAKDLEEYFEKIHYMPKEGDICLLRSGAGEYYGTPEFLSHQCGVGREGTLWLIDKGVRVTGTDAWSWDIPMPMQAANFKKDHDVSKLWEGHRTSKEKWYMHMEKLANLDKIPVVGAKIICLPVKVNKASAGWCRAVAIIDD